MELRKIFLSISFINTKFKDLFFWYVCVVLFVDLSTLANVVTTLATMSKNVEEDPVPSNGDTGLEGDTTNNAAKAFDTLAKAVQPQVTLWIDINGCPITRVSEIPVWTSETRYTLVRLGRDCDYFTCVKIHKY